MIILRPFTQSDGYIISQWVSDLDYFKFFRNNAFLPTVEDCCNFPAWAQNIIMILEKDGQTIGMVNAYQVNIRNKTAHAGCLIDKKFQGNNTGHDAMTRWITYVFNRFGFRKIFVEHVDEYLTAAYLSCGFTQAGRLKGNCDIMGQWMDEIVLECFRDDWKPVVREGEKE
jgi:RimJ/RimL family protein N-acetyltransferase